MESEVRTHGKLDLFEIGTVFPAIGKEERHLLLFSAEMNGDAIKTFFAQKSELIKIFHALGVDSEIKPCLSPSKIFHPAQCADIFIKNEKIGHIAVLHPTKNTVRGSVVVFTELNLKMLEPFVSQAERKYVPISSFPAVHRDISLVVKNNILQSDLISAAKKASEYLVSIELFDVFVDEKKLGSGNKNLAFHLTFQSSTRTLDETTIDSATKSVYSSLEKNFNAQLRLAFDQEKP
jgi:phenylalanyl-tRNA synthetase beta chain